MTVSDLTRIEPQQIHTATVSASVDCTGLVDAATWCEKHNLSAKQTAVVVQLQQRKASLDLDYILTVGELVLDVQREFQGKLYEECCKDVLGVSPRTAGKYCQVYLLKQQIPELSETSVNALSIRALTALENSKRSYELSESEKRNIIQLAEERVRDEEKLLTERTINDLKATLKEEALQQAREGVQELLDGQSGEINTQKERIATLLNTVEELRAKMGTDVPSAEIAQAAVSKPVEGSVTDRATPSLSMLRSEDGKSELDKAQVVEITRWIAEKRKRIEQDIKEFDQIYALMQTQFQKRGRSYNLFWEGVDLVWQDLPGTTAWKAAYGASGDREKALKSLAMKVTELGQKLVTLDRQTHYREGEFRIVE